MKKSKEELQKQTDEQLQLQKIALEKDFSKLEKTYKAFVDVANKQEASNQLVSRIQGIRRDLLMTIESISQITMLIEQ